MIQYQEHWTWRQCRALPLQGAKPQMRHHVCKDGEGFHGFFTCEPGQTTAPHRICAGCMYMNNDENRCFTWAMGVFFVSEKYQITGGSCNRTMRACYVL